MDDLIILKTDEDKNGTDIIKMSNFLENYIIDSLSSLINVNSFKIIDSISFNPALISAPSFLTSVVYDSKTCLIPDFNTLSPNIRENLQKGTYKIANSKQVNGNLRPTIVNENNVRVKDITLKTAKNPQVVFDSLINLAKYMQMQHIYNALEDIKEKQDFIIDRIYDQTIVIPFLDARNYILTAQEGKISSSERINYLLKAIDKLITATNGLYTNVMTSTKYLIKLNNSIFFRKVKDIQIYVANITSDIQRLSQMNGLIAQVYKYLDDLKSSNLVINQYQNELYNTLLKKIPNKNYCISEMIHLNYPYEKENLNSWLKITDILKHSQDEPLNNQNIFVISIEEDTKDAGYAG